MARTAKYTLWLDMPETDMQEQDDFFEWVRETLKKAFGEKLVELDLEGTVKS